MLTIREVENKAKWEEFAKSYPAASFLQSWNWGEFALKEGRKIYRLGLYSNEALVGINLVVEVKSKRAKYLESHAGPLLNYQSPDDFRVMHEHVKDLAEKSGVHFFRIRPPFYYGAEKIADFQKLGYVKAPMYFQAEHTLRLDLAKTTDELSQGMRKQTRYYVKQAEKAGVTVRFSRDPSDLKILFNLYKETVERQHFVAYDLKFFEWEFAAFSPDDQVQLVIAECEGKPLASAMILNYADTGYYHHAGSIRLEPDVYASYLMQWEIIKHFKEMGMKTYDFFGVAPTDDPKHKRAGLTLFKRGFGGERVRFMNTLDYPLVPLRYWPLYLFVKFEKLRKGL